MRMPRSPAGTGGSGLECILGEAMSDSVTLTAVLAPDENGWRVVQPAEMYRLRDVRGPERLLIGLAQELG